MNWRATLGQRFQKNRNVVMTVVVLLLGLLLLGLIVGAQTIFAQELYQPGVSIQSGLQADYSGQRHNTAVAQVGVGIIEDVIRDAQVGRADEGPQALSAAQRLATVQAALLTPVPTVTPNPTQLAAQLTALANAPTAASTPTLESTATKTRTPSITAFPTETPLPTETPSVTTTISRTPSTMPTSTRPPNTATRTATTVGVIPTATRTNTLMPTNTRTATLASTATRTNTPVPSSTFTPSRTSTFTHTPTRTNTLTPSSTRTNTFTPSQTPSRTPTNTFTPSSTSTNTPSNTATRTLTPSQTPTVIPSPTFTPSHTATATFTFTPSPTSATAACIPAVADGINSLAVLRVPGAMTVDGNLSEDVWQVLYPVQNLADGSQFDNVGWFSMAWDSTYLYYGFKILDNQIRNDSIDPWQDDSIEAFLDGGNEGSATYDGNDFGFVVGWNDPVLFEQNGRIFGVLFATADVAGGYSIELAVPWTLIGGTVFPGRIVGVDGIINDDDNNNARESQLVWTGTTNNFQNTSVFGDGVLVDNCTPLPAGQTFGVGSFTLINADTDQPIAGFDPIPPGATITLSSLPTANLNLRANTLGEPASLKFSYEGNPDFGLENTEPFSLFGDAANNYDYNGGTLTTGAKTLSATPYSQNGATGTVGQTYTLNFTVAN